MQIKSSPRLPSWQPNLIPFDIPIDSESNIKPCTLKLFQVPILAPGLCWSMAQTASLCITLAKRSAKIVEYAVEQNFCLLWQLNCNDISVFDSILQQHLDDRSKTMECLRQKKADSHCVETVGVYMQLCEEPGKPRLCHPLALQWRHNDLDCVSNHQPRGCLLKRLFRRRSKKTSKLRVTGLCVGNSPGPVKSPYKGPVTRKMFPFDDVIMAQP